MPQHVREVWEEIVASNELAGTVDRQALEAYCHLIARLRAAQARIESEGMVVRDTKGKVIPHPALEVERKMTEAIRAWGDRFAPLVKPSRKRGYMADATATAISAAPHLQGEGGKLFTALVAAARTQAWLIDEAQRDSMAALNEAVVKIMPQYVKTCAELQITPASVASVAAPAPAQSATAREGGKSSGVTSLRDRAAARRQTG